MKSTHFILVFAILLSTTAPVSAQGFLKKLGNKVVERAQNKVEEKFDKLLDKAFEGKDKKKAAAEAQADSAIQAAPIDESEGLAKKAPAQEMPIVPQEQQLVPKEEPLEVVYAKSDFVAGDEIFFDDDLTDEILGEFPSRWDLIEGNVEICKLNGENVIQAMGQDDASIVPLFEDMKKYLPEMFTLEFDFWVGPNAGVNDDSYPQNYYKLFLYNGGNADNYWLQTIELLGEYYVPGFSSFVSCAFYPVASDISGESRFIKEENTTIKPNSWNHFALSFNKRAMKVYVNGNRYINIPNTIAPSHFRLEFYRTPGWYNNNSSIKNLRLAKGAVPLYDRMMSDGKFISYGIYFDVGKSIIKPESMGEINRIVKLMNDNPTLNFSVEGHTDSTGNAASNQTLSEARAKAIVDKLVEMGISASRLSFAGKGQNSPIADNSTDEGRTKNRRVEFVKK